MGGSSSHGSHGFRLHPPRLVPSPLSAPRPPRPPPCGVSVVMPPSLCQQLTASYRGPLIPRRVKIA